MADDDDPTIEEETTEETETEEDDDDEESIPKSKVDRMIQNRAKKAGRAALNQLSKETGMSVAQLKDLAKDHAARTEAEQSEVDKAKAAAAQAQAEANTAKAEAKRETLRARIATALVSVDEESGEGPCRPDRVGAAVKFALTADLDDADPDDMDEQVETAVAYVRAQLPDLFVSSGDDEHSNGDGQGSVRTPGAPVRRSSERKKPGTKSPRDRAKERFEQMKAAQKRPDLQRSSKSE